MASPKYTLLRVGAAATPAQGVALANQLRPFFVGPPGFGASIGSASESSAGILDIAAQAEVDAGLDDLRAVTPPTLATSLSAALKFNDSFGDGSATSFVITHNFNTFDVQVEVVRNSGNRDTVLVEVRRTSLNAVTIPVDSAPTSNEFRALVRA